MTTARRPSAMLLAAGLGTRLRPLTNEVPKPLVWLGDRPLIDSIVAELSRAGFERAVVNTHHLAERFDDLWKAAQPIAVATIFEPVILGTGGGLSNASTLLGGGDVLIWNADIAAELDVEALLADHGRAACASTLVTGPRLSPRQGTVGLDDEGRVVRVRAFDRGGEVASANYAGIALVSETVRALLPGEGCLVGDGFIPALEKGLQLATHTLAAPFFDLGTPELYLDANVKWLERRGLDAWVHPTASIGPGVRLERAVVALGAKVEGEGTLRECVVWPGATAHAPCSGAVITRTEIVSRRPLRDA